MTLDDAIKELEQMIINMKEASRQYSASDMIQGGVKMTTLYDFVYKQNTDVFATNIKTLKAIAMSLDSLSDSTYYNNLTQSINKFVDTFILIKPIGELVKDGLNYTTLNKFKCKDLSKSYVMRTLINYAMLIEKEEVTF